MHSLFYACCSLQLADYEELTVLDTRDFHFYCAAPAGDAELLPGLPLQLAARAMGKGRATLLPKLS